MMTSKLEFSLYNTDEKKFICKATVAKLSQVTGFQKAYIWSCLRYTTYKSGYRYKCERLNCNITFRKR